MIEKEWFNPSLANIVGERNCHVCNIVNVHLYDLYVRFGVGVSRGIYQLVTE